MNTSWQMKLARTALEWEQKELAEKAGLSVPTIQRMESLGLDRSSLGNVKKVQEAFWSAGIEFINEGECQGVKLCHAKK